jgi:hypothetical protein
MTSPHRWFLVCVLALGSASVRAQISPGELSAPHASLEGVDKCTSCHSFGKNIDNEKCLVCHTEIADRVASRAGLHGGLRSHKCIECHKEHHGREFSIVRFDTAHFDHARSGFTLTGKHARTACAACHRPSNVREERVRNNAARMKAGTFLGLGRECLSCHKDHHGGQFKKACTTCHGQERWKPATGFSHGQAQFTLTGRHEKVACDKCHIASSPGGVIAYTGLKFASCSSCHKDPHGGKFKKSCESCHSTAGWGSGVAAHFDHSTTRFPLRGKHAATPCERCHRGRETGSARFVIREFGKCADCHADPHRGKYVPAGVTKPCEECHVESGWKDGKALSFDHGQTRFGLRDAHKAAQCAKCHGTAGQQAMRASLARRQVHYECDDCHQDAHDGQFATAARRTGCERCHNERTFLPPSYSVSDHLRAAFPLTGSHTAVPCDECHKKVTLKGKALRQFHWDRMPACRDCHKDVHRGQFDRFAQQGCIECHSTRSWNDVRFGHERTAFPLTGKHVGVACHRCHGPGGNNAPLAEWRFAGTPQKCVDCHGRNVGPL